MWDHSDVRLHDIYVERVSMGLGYVGILLRLTSGPDYLTEFGGMVSTSNEIAGDKAIVITDKYMLWTIEFRL
jgi:hypothetical protein